MGRSKFRAGNTVLAIHLILLGLVYLLGLSFEGLHLVQGALALVAGILLLIGR